jgi:membrane-bound lytic murein transglycosylase D
MTERSQFRHWLLVALVVACTAGASVAAPALAHPAAGSKTASKSETSSPEKKKTKAERRAEERRAREERDQANAAAAATATGGATAPGGAPTAASPAPPENAAPATAPAVASAEPPEPANGEPADATDADLAAGSADGQLSPQEFEPEPLADNDVETAVTPAPVTGPDAAKLLADSLAAYESAHSLWEQGLVDEAFAALDRAYELMAAVDVERDPLRAQEKEDLRRLISRRVVEIYASRPTAGGDLAGSIPIEVNEHVQREILSFSGPERNFFLDAYARSGIYRPMILDELRSAGMPLELAWMPIVESGFKTRAYSTARALGMWQFIASTGYRFGLERSNWIDERMDPHKSTKAALAYLTELHGLFGDWLTALAAYNCGEHLVLRLLSSQPVSYFDHFWDLYVRLPQETRRYVPRFIAVLAILQDPAAYGFTLPDPQPALDFDLVRTERTADLTELERRLQLPDGAIKGLNPELRRNATPTDPYDVKVPRGMVEQVATTITQLPQHVLTADVAPASGSSGGTTHRVRPGETLGKVAAQYGTTIQALVALNGLKSANQIHPGQTLRIRTSSTRSSSGISKSSSGKSGVKSSAGSSTRSASSGGGGAGTTHRVREGDTLWLIAQRYGTTVERIKLDNGLRGNLLTVGQKLTITVPRVSTGAG